MTTYLLSYQIYKMIAPLNPASESKSTEPRPPQPGIFAGDSENVNEEAESSTREEREWATEAGNITP